VSKGFLEIGLDWTQNRFIPKWTLFLDQPPTSPPVVPVRNENKVYLFLLKSQYRIDCNRPTLKAMDDINFPTAPRRKVYQSTDDITQILPRRQPPPHQLRTRVYVLLQSHIR